MHSFSQFRDFLLTDIIITVNAHEPIMLEPFIEKSIVKERFMTVVNLLYLSMLTLGLNFHARSEV